MGAGNSTTANDTFYGRDSGGVDQDAVPLNAIHVKKVISVSDAQRDQPALEVYLVVEDTLAYCTENRIHDLGTKSHERAFNSLCY